MERCEWPGNDELYVHYHDAEWGVPVHDDQKLFEAVVLDGFQAGLSWITILKKRENFRAAFDQFDAEKIARYDDKKIQELINDKGIIRNKLKIAASVSNAKAYLEIQDKYGSFDDFIWQFTNGKTIQNHWKSMSELPAFTKESDLMSKEMKKLGFKFCGSTICYAFMQAVGMVNDHTTNCFRFQELS